MSLINPIHTIEDAETKELVKFFNETLGFCPNSVLTMQKNPAIAKAFINLNMAVMKNHGSLTSEFKRLIAFVSSNTTGCRYCQAHTIRAAERYGASKERLENIWNFEESDCFSDQEKIALRFTREASKVPVATTQEMEEELKQHWSEDDIIEMMGVIALFGYLNRWNDVMGTSLEDDAIESANQYLKEKGWDIGKHD
tara:strand:+ start:1067 stop:1657 length:591 start_codon:yes stop_codon:yes gene_type:complete